jgi:hypothetical protein
MDIFSPKLCTLVLDFPLFMGKRSQWENQELHTAPSRIPRCQQKFRFLRPRNVRTTFFPLGIHENVLRPVTGSTNDQNSTKTERASHLHKVYLHETRFLCCTVSYYIKLPTQLELILIWSDAVMRNAATQKLCFV